MRFSFILLASGDSSRFKSKIPKQYQEIMGKTLIDISIDKIRSFKEITKIVLVYNKRHKKYLKKIDLKNITLIIGGKTRNESTLKALDYLKNQNTKGKVLIHDAARPNFSKKLIKNIIINSYLNRVVVPVLKIQDALKEKKGKKKFLNTEKNNFFLTQTPQSFNLDEIFHLHKKKELEYRDDDLSLIDTSLGVKFISGEKKNFKVTDIDDFKILKNFNKSNQKIGIGFDVHRLVKGRKLFLGGIKIPSKLGTLGHSDGDPILHSIIDALLGACALGDIGEKFSDKNKKFKNIDSSILVKKILEEVKEKNYVINNIDINIITQYPKLKKYKKMITKNIAKLCQVSIENINIKAKTTEKLGVIGREQAIAAEVIMSVIKYD
tara:strand:- start:792 stop:1928 length:1137 start_codon:yes stop_codon:yes gene_type:complete